MSIRESRKQALENASQYKTQTAYFSRDIPDPADDTGQHNMHLVERFRSVDYENIPDNAVVSFDTDYVPDMMFRVICECGWLSKLYENKLSAQSAMKRHSEKMKS